MSWEAGEVRLVGSGGATGNPSLWHWCGSYRCVQDALWEFSVLSQVATAQQVALRHSPRNGSTSLVSLGIWLQPTCETKGLCLPLPSRHFQNHSIWQKQNPRSWRKGKEEASPYKWNGDFERQVRCCQVYSREYNKLTLVSQVIRKFWYHKNSEEKLYIHPNRNMGGILYNTLCRGCF